MNKVQLSTLKRWRRNSDRDPHDYAWLIWREEQLEKRARFKHYALKNTELLLLYTNQELAHISRLYSKANERVAELERFRDKQAELINALQLSYSNLNARYESLKNANTANR